jgi:hypothetical protein
LSQWSSGAGVSQAPGSTFGAHSVDVTAGEAVATASVDRRSPLLHHNDTTVVVTASGALLDASIRQ